ncbi:MAG: molybdopterin-guanine dinucleotide biosynthesis protein A [Gammaproteobacteria bacterium]|jgi:molybdopterin-guanine dinucleotide biosynthesis protein A
MHSNFTDITAVILAGGQARRMGGQDKGLIEVSGKPMIEYLITALRVQLDNIIINANRNQDIYGKYGFPVIADNYEGFNGPLAGMASCMKVIETKYMITAPCDSPNLPADYVLRMFNALEEHQSDISVADSGERIQPVFSLLKCSLLDSLLDYLDSGERKIDRWFEQHAMTRVDFSDKPETFINVNTLEDIKNIEASPGV